MESAKKKYIFAWGFVGVFFPTAMLLISRYAPNLPAKVPHFVVAAISPLIMVMFALALVVTDAGGDSGGLLPSTIIVAIVLLLNGALYAGVGWLSWPIFKRLRGRFKNPPES
jgi:hypothetical protein